MHAASSAALPGSNSRPAPVPSTSSARPPVRATTSGAPPASASRATMPNGSYSDGMTTHPARWTSVAQLVVGQEAGEVDEVADALEVDLRLQLGQVAAAAADDALDAGHARAQQPHRPGEHLEALLVLHAAPREHERLAAAGRPRPSTTTSGRCRWGSGGCAPAGSSKPSTTSRTMNRELASTAVGAVGEPRLDGVDRARLARRDPPAVVAALGASGTWRRAWRRTASASVSAAQATCQSWAWTTSGRHGTSRADSWTRWWFAEATRATRSSSGSHGRSVRARSTRTPPTIAVGRRPRVAQREQGDVVAGGGQRLAEPVDVGARPRRPTGAGTPRSASGPASAPTLTRGPSARSRPVVVHSPSGSPVTHRGHEAGPGDVACWALVTASFDERPQPLAGCRARCGAAPRGPPTAAPTRTAEPPRERQLLVPREAGPPAAVERRRS